MRERIKLRPLLTLGLVTCSLPVLADTRGSTHGDTGGVVPDSTSISSTNFTIHSKAVNTWGGDGSATANLNFMGGYLGTLAHACVQPPQIGNLQSDSADGRGEVDIVNEFFTVTSDTLPNNTLTQVKMCLEITSRLVMDIDGSPRFINANYAQNFSKWTVTGSNGYLSTDFGTHRYSNDYGPVTGSGIFAGLAGQETGTIMREFVIPVRIGSAIKFSFEASSYASAGARTEPEPEPLVFGNAGLGVTFGLAEAELGTHLISQTTGEEFFGTCGGSVNYVPNYPVPEPEAFLIAPAGIAAIARKRKKTSKK